MVEAEAVDAPLDSMLPPGQPRSPERSSRTTNSLEGDHRPTRQEEHHPESSDAFLLDSSGATGGSSSSFPMSPPNVLRKQPQQQAAKPEPTDNDDNNHCRVIENASPASSLPLSMKLLQFAPCANCQNCNSGAWGRGVGGGAGGSTAALNGYFSSPWEQQPSKSFKNTDVNAINHEKGVGNRSHLAFTNLASMMANNNNQSDDDDDDEDDDIHSVVLADYDMQALHRQNSATSPLVAAPMMMPLTADALSKSHAVVMERILHDYRQACQFYGCGHRVNAGVLTTLRFSLPCLRVSGSFHDADMLAVVEILLRYGNGPLRYIHRLDFTIGSKEGKLHGRRGFRSHGALALAKVLQKSDYITEVLVQRNRIGPFGASAIFMACANNTTIRKLGLRRCCVCERGAFAFAELIAPSSNCGLTHVDLSANYIGFRGSMAIEQALAARWKQRPELPTIVVDLEGNLVFQEVMNGVTHGLGVLLAFVGSYLLHQRVQGLTPRHTVSCMVYSTSLIVLYVSSTLYHSFFTMQNTKYIFEVMDKCAIYVLIAGSYTPFLRIALWHEPLWSVYLLAFIWICSVLGITVEAFFPTWKYRNLFSLAMYLGMGWSAMICLPEVGRLLPESAMNFMILGGISYTVGVPFFVRNNNLDHAIWHLFVLGGSFFHWCGIYFHVATLAINET